MQADIDLAPGRVCRKAGWTCHLCGEDMRNETLAFVGGVAVHWMCGYDYNLCREAIANGRTDLVPSRLLDAWPELRPTVRADYDAYLKTPAWRRVRDEAIARANGRCALCDAEGPLQGHHRTYRNLGHELPGDVIALCRRCHATFHRVSA